MWLLTDTGSVSVVNNGIKIMIRALDKQFWESIAKSAKTESSSTFQNVYLYQVIAIYELLAEWALHMSLNIGYKSFKSEVTGTSWLGFTNPPIKVWSEIHVVEESGELV